MFVRSFNSSLATICTMKTLLPLRVPLVFQKHQMIFLSTLSCSARSAPPVRTLSAQNMKTASSATMANQTNQTKQEQLGLTSYILYVIASLGT